MEQLKGDIDRVQQFETSAAKAAGVAKQTVLEAKLVFSIKSENVESLALLLLKL